jgi:hypothetical protein
MSLLVNSFSHGTTGAAGNIVGFIAADERFTDSFSVSLPGGIQAGDIGMIFVGAFASAFVATGWTVSASATSGTRFFRVLTKVLDGSESTVTISGGTLSASGNGVCGIVIRGSTAVTSRFSGGTTTNTATATGFTKTAGSDYLVCVTMTSTAAGTSITGPAAFTQEQNEVASQWMIYLGSCLPTSYIDGTSVVTTTVTTSSDLTGHFVMELT